jgi:catechol 2,3-dioxygenase-like lactoylglutathione lyase family enzyme
MPQHQGPGHLTLTVTDRTQSDSSCPRATECGATVHVKSLGHLVLYVRDLERSRRFYADVLGWREMRGDTPVPFPAAAFSSGRTHHELPLIEVGLDAAPIPADHRGRHDPLSRSGLAESARMIGQYGGRLGVTALSLNVAHQARSPAPQGRPEEISGPDLPPAVAIAPDRIASLHGGASGQAPHVKSMSPDQG